MLKNPIILAFVILLLRVESSNGQQKRELNQLDSLLEKAYHMGVFNGNFR